MENDPHTGSETLVLQESDCQVTSWNDHRGQLTFRTVFSADATATEHFATGVAELAEGGYLALHRHEQPETYFVLSGTGLVTLGGIDHPVCAGSNVLIPGMREHGITNTGIEPLRFFYALAAATFTDIDYVFS